MPPNGLTAMRSTNGHSGFNLSWAIPIASPSCAPPASNGSKIHLGRDHPQDLGYLPHIRLTLIALSHARSRKYSSICKY